MYRLCPFYPAYQFCWAAIREGRVEKEVHPCYADTGKWEDCQMAITSTVWGARAVGV